MTCEGQFIAVECTRRKISRADLWDRVPTLFGHCAGDGKLTFNFDPALSLLNSRPATVTLEISRHVCNQIHLNEFPLNRCGTSCIARMSLFPKFELEIGCSKASYIDLMCRDKFQQSESQYGT